MFSRGTRERRLLEAPARALEAERLRSYLFAWMNSRQGPAPGWRPGPARRPTGRGGGSFPPGKPWPKAPADPSAGGPAIGPTGAGPEADQGCCGLTGRARDEDTARPDVPGRPAGSERSAETFGPRSLPSRVAANPDRSARGGDRCGPAGGRPWRVIVAGLELDRPNPRGRPDSPGDRVRSADPLSHFGDAGRPRSPNEDVSGVKCKIGGDDGRRVACESWPPCSRDDDAPGEAAHSRTRTGRPWHELRGTTCPSVRRDRPALL